MDINNLWSEYDLNSKKQNSRCLTVNTILEGKYLVGPVLGQGGFGITYAGYDLNMETKIAIKEYFPVELVSRDTTTIHGDRVLSLGGEKSVTYKAGLKKYVAEAQNVSQFSEVPGVVSVKDFFYANETAYIVMEFIDGISLKDYLKERGGRLSEEETLRIMKPILEAMVQVHKSGMIHRDISPDNIMLTFTGAGEHGNTGVKDSSSGKSPAGAGTGIVGAAVARGGTAGAATVGAAISGTGNRSIQSVKLIDFGAARITEKNDQKSLTIILKHGYAPEEQYRTRGEQGPWTDVYALCAVLYRMLTGETPVPAMDRMFQDELKTFEQQGIKVSANTKAAILKGLAVKKADRIQSVQELMGALYEGAKIRKAKTAGTNLGFWQKHLWLIGMGAAAGVIGFVALFRMGGNATAKIPSNQTMKGAQNGETTQITQDAPVETGADGAAELLVDTSAQEEQLGEQIVFYHPQRSIATSGEHVLFCMQDGTVKARGDNENGECEVEDWTDVVAVAAGGDSSFGLRTDGTVLYTGDEQIANVELWNDLIDIQPWGTGAVGLKKDGTVVSICANGYFEEDLAIMDQLSSWKQIKAIAANDQMVYGLTEEGTLISASLISASEETTVLAEDWGNVEYLLADIYFGERGLLSGLCEDGTVKSISLEKEENDFYLQNMLNSDHVSQIDNRICVHEDGSVSLIERSQGSTYQKELQQAVEDWTEVQSAVMFSHKSGHYYALKKDGTILYSAPNMGNAELEDMKNLEWIRLFELDGCENMIAYTKDGKVLAKGGTSNLDELIFSLSADPTLEERVYIGMELGIMAEVDEVAAMGKMEEFGIEGGMILDPSVEYVETGWTAPEYYKQICSEAADVLYFDEGVVLKKDGTAVFHNAQEQKYSNVKDVESSNCEAVLFHDGTVEVVNGVQNHENVNEWTDIVQLATYNRRIRGLRADGTVLNEYDRELPVEKNIKKIFASENLHLGITEEDKVVVIEHGEMAEANGMLQVDNWGNIESVAIGKSHTVGLRKDGTVVATGRNGAGQCDVDEWTDVVSIVAGSACTLGITANGDLLIAGELY